MKCRFSSYRSFARALERTFCVNYTLKIKWLLWSKLETKISYLGFDNADEEWVACWATAEDEVVDEADEEDE